LSSLLDELELDPVEELELDELLDSELELLAVVLELEDPADEDGLVGLPPPPQAARTPTPASAAPPESRIRNSRRCDRFSSSDKWDAPSRRARCRVRRPSLADGSPEPTA
jgi:hypothetical protein